MESSERKGVGTYQDPSYGRGRWNDFLTRQGRSGNVRRMTRKCIYVTAGVAACACLLIVVAIFPRSSVTKASFDRITDRMTRAEVEEIFAEKGRVFFESEFHIEVAVSWDAPDGSGASILFENDRVIRKEWMDSREPILGRMRNWIRILKTATQI